MPKQTNLPAGALEITESEPIVMVGNPVSLRGNLYLRNPTSERVILHTLPLSTHAPGQLALRSSRPEAGLKVRLSPGILRPGHEGRVSLSLALDPYTPPGEYQAILDIAGQAQPVVMHVTEKVSLSVSPSQLVIENRPNHTVEKRIVISNRGNVTLNIGDIGGVALDDDLMVCRTLRAAAAEVGDELRPLNEYLAQILLQAKHTAEKAGILRIKYREKNVVIKPGETRPIDLEIRVPSTLDKRGRYTGVVPIYTANLTFLIVPATGTLPASGTLPATGVTESEKKRVTENQ